MRQHYQTPPPAPSSLNPHLSPAIDTVLLRALAKQPEERFPSIMAFAHAFQEAAQSNEERAAESPPPFKPSLEPTNSAESEKGIAPTMLAALTPRAPVEMTTPAGHPFPRAATAMLGTEQMTRHELINELLEGFLNGLVLR